jgi:hypothetical protein
MMRFFYVFFTRAFLDKSLREHVVKNGVTSERKPACGR